MTTPKLTDERFDHIVVGGGSAGCVLAARLTEDPSIRVLLLEAGPEDTDENIHMPAGWGKLLRTSLDWNFHTEEQKHAQGRRMYWPRGKMLGGSSSINALVYIRGAREDYDHWAALGNEGWGYDDVLPYFIRAEDNARGRSEFHGVGGPLGVSDTNPVHPWSKAFVASCVAAGYPANPDFNGAKVDGAGIYQTTTRNGKRCSAAVAYLNPARARKNLVIRTNALAHKVVVLDGTAAGVEYSVNGRTTVAWVDGEVLLAAGAIASPQLLQLSGIGPIGLLKDLDIGVVADIPGVGENLMDHPGVPVTWRARDEGSLRSYETLPNYLNWKLRGKGPLTTNGAEGGLYCRSSAELEVPDLQFHFVPTIYKDHGFGDVTMHGFSIGNILVDVHSTGSIMIKSRDPRWAPAIDAGYLSDERDLEALVGGIKICREVGAQTPMASLSAGEMYPGSATTSDADLRDFVRATVETLYHPTCTTRMGDDDMSVVDSQLRVRGIAGLRVVDASVMPRLVRGNTNAPTMMIAEKAADMITGRRPPVASRALATV